MSYIFKFRMYSLNTQVLPSLQKIEQLSSSYFTPLFKQLSTTLVDNCIYLSYIRKPNASDTRITSLIQLTLSCQASIGAHFASMAKDIKVVNHQSITHRYFSDFQDEIRMYKIYEILHCHCIDGIEFIRLLKKITSHFGNSR